MYKGKTIGVVVPAYNEEGFVSKVIDSVPAFVDRVYVIDDRSTDRTWEEIQRHAEKANQNAPNTPMADGGAVFDTRVVPLRHEENRGVGGAIKTGYTHARGDGIDVTAVMNGDAQMDPDILDRIIDPIVEGEADYAKGNRLVYREYRQGMSRWRFLGNSILTFLTKIASGYWKMMDPQNGYTAISYRALEQIEIDGLYEDYGFCNDVLVRLNASNVRIADISMPAVYGDEKSSIRYSTFIPKVSRLLLWNFLWRLKVKYFVRDFHPLALFYYLGAFTVGVATLSFGAAFLPSVGGESTFVTGLLSMTLYVIGCILLLSAMVFDMQANEELEMQVYD